MHLVSSKPRKRSGGAGGGGGGVCLLGNNGKEQGRRRMRKVSFRANLVNEAGVRERKRCGSIIRVSRIVSVEALCMLDKEEEGEEEEKGRGLFIDK